MYWSPLRLTVGWVNMPWRSTPADTSDVMTSFRSSKQRNERKPRDGGRGWFNAKNSKLTRNLETVDILFSERDCNSLHKEESCVKYKYIDSVSTGYFWWVSQVLTGRHLNTLCGRQERNNRSQSQHTIICFSGQILLSNKRLFLRRFYAHSGRRWKCALFVRACGSVRYCLLAG